MEEEEENINMVAEFKTAVNVMRDDLLDIQKEMLDTIEFVDKYSWDRGTQGGLSWGIDQFDKAFDMLQPGLVLVAGQPNVGKSALCMQMTWNIANANREVTPEKPYKAYVLYFSLDDNCTEILPRVIGLDQKIPINVVKAPAKYKDNVHYMSRRESGINNLKEALPYFKIQDANQGTSIEYIEETIDRHHKELIMQDETYKLVVIIDNFHDITIDSGKGMSSNEKYEEIADRLSKLCTKYDIPLICTAEFRKINGNRRPINDDIREAVKISYEAKAILLCYNEVGLRGEAATVFYERQDVPYKQPIFEVKIGKNKYGSFKGRLFFEFFPDMSYLREVNDEGTKMYNSRIVG